MDTREARLCACGQHGFVLCTFGKISLFDPDDLPVVSGGKWSTTVRKYAHRQKSGRRVLLHRAVARAKPGQEIDHINGDTFDNRKSNLRVVNKAQNQMNRYAVVSKHGFKGVTRNHKRFMAALKFRDNGKVVRRYLGTFDTPEQAAAAYDNEAERVFGAYAKTNKSLGLL